MTGTGTDTSKKDTEIKKSKVIQPPPTDSTTMAAVIETTIKEEPEPEPEFEGWKVTVTCPLTECEKPFQLTFPDLLVTDVTNKSEYESITVSARCKNEFCDSLVVVDKVPAKIKARLRVLMKEPSTRHYKAYRAYALLNGLIIMGVLLVGLFISWTDRFGRFTHEGTELTFWIKCNFTSLAFFVVQWCVANNFEKKTKMKFDYVVPVIMFSVCSIFTIGIAIGEPTLWSAIGTMTAFSVRFILYYCIALLALDLYDLLKTRPCTSKDSKDSKDLKDSKDSKEE